MSKIHGSQLESTISDGSVPISDSESIEVLLSNISNRVKAITGEVNWKISPQTSIKQLIDGLTDTASIDLSFDNTFKLLSATVNDAWLSSNTIRNQFGSSQSASAWIGNNFRADGRLFVNTTGISDEKVSFAFDSNSTYNQGLAITDTFASANGAMYIGFRKSDGTLIGSIRRHSTNDALFIGGGTYLAFGNSNTEYARLTNVGNFVLGGTDNTVDKLQVTGNSIFTGRIIADRVRSSGILSNRVIDLWADNGAINIGSENGASSLFSYKIDNKSIFQESAPNTTYMTLVPNVYWTRLYIEASAYFSYSSVFNSSLTITNSPSTSAGGFELLTRNTSTGVVEKVASNYYALSGAISGTVGRLAKFGTSGTVVDSIITESGSNIQIGNGTASENVLIIDALTYSGIRLTRAGVNKWGLFNNNAGANFFDIYNYNTGSTSLSISPTNQIITNVASNTGEHFIVGGSARVNGNLGVVGNIVNNYTISTSTFGLDSIGLTKIANGLLFRLGAISGVTNGFTSQLNASNDAVIYSFDYGNVGIGVNPTNAKLEVVSTTGEVFRADANGGALRVVANQTGVLLGGEISLTTTPTTSASTFDLITRNTSTGVLEKVSSSYYATAGSISGTTGRLAKFTSSGAVGDSIVSESGSAITIGGTLQINVATGYNALFQQSGTDLRINYLNQDLSANVSASYRAVGYNWQDNGGASIMSLSSTQLTTFGATGSEAHIFGGSARVNGKLTVDDVNGISILSSANFGLNMYYDNGTGYSYIDSKYDSASAGRLYIRTRTSGTPINALWFLGSGEATFSSSVTAGGTISVVSTGVDGTFQDAFIARYSGNNAETNAILTAVSSTASGSGFRFDVSNGGGSSARTTALTLTRAAATFSSSVTAASFSTAGLLNTSDRLWITGDVPISSWLSSSLTGGYSATSSYGWVNADTSLRLGVNGTVQLNLTSSSATFSNSITSGAIRINQAVNETPFQINSSSSSNPAYTQYLIGNSGGWEVGMANLANGYAYQFSYGSFGTATKFSLTNTGVGTFSSNVLTGGYFESTLLSGEVFKATSGTTGVITTRLRNTGGDFYVGIESSVAGSFFTGSSAYASVLYSNTNQEFIVAATKILTLGTSGSVFNGTVAGSSFTTNNRTILANGGVYDNSSNGNNLGIAFGSSAIMSTTGDGTLAVKDFGSATYRWGTLYAQSGNFSSNITISGDLIVDTNTLYVDATNNKVGIGMTPYAKLDVNGVINSTSTSGYSLGSTTLLPNGVGGFYHTDGATTGYVTLYANLGGLRLGVEGNSNALDFIKSTGAATFSSNLTISGKSAINASVDNNYQLIINSSTGIYNTRFHDTTNVTSRYNVNVFTAVYTGAVGLIGVGGSTTGNTTFNDAFVVGTQTAYPLRFATNDVYRGQITSTGNFELGATLGSDRKFSVRGQGASHLTYTAEFANSSGGTIFLLRDDGVAFIDDRLVINSFSDDNTNKLQVSGSSIFSSNVTIGGSILKSGTNTNLILSANGTGLVDIRGDGGLVIKDSLGSGVHGYIDSTSGLYIGLISNASTDTDKFLVSDTGVIKYRTGSQLLSDIGAAPSSGGSGYIQNQFTSAQTASFWISGSGKINGDLYVGANGAYISETQVGGTYELRVFDSAGNSTVFSPHNFSKIPGGASEEMAWSFYSERHGKYVNVDMMKVVRLVESLTEEQLVFIGEV